MECTKWLNLSPFIFVRLDSHLYYILRKWPITHFHHTQIHEPSNQSNMYYGMRIGFIAKGFNESLVLKWMQLNGWFNRICLQSLQNGVKCAIKCANSMIIMMPTISLLFQFDGFFFLTACVCVCVCFDGFNFSTLMPNKAPFPQFKRCIARSKFHHCIGYAVYRSYFVKKPIWKWWNVNWTQISFVMHYIFLIQKLKINNNKCRNGKCKMWQCMCDDEFAVAHKQPCT